MLRDERRSRRDRRSGLAGGLLGQAGDALAGLEPFGDLVKADAGAMGGSKSEEFLHPTPIGEDTFVRTDGGYAANVEAFTTAAPPARSFEKLTPAEVLDTPDTPTIATLVALANEKHPRPDGRAWTAADTLKNIVLALTHYSRACSAGSAVAPERVTRLAAWIETTAKIGDGSSLELQAQMAQPSVPAAKTACGLQ